MAVAPVVDEGPSIIQSSERRIVIPTNILTAIVLAAVGYWAGVQIGNGLALNDALNTGVLLGYTLASIMFLVGIGFANYPLARLFGWRVTPLRSWSCRPNTAFPCGGLGERHSKDGLPPY